MMRDKIYFLLDLHKKCSQIIISDKITVQKYCDFVNFELNKYFTIEEQKKIKMDNFDYVKLSLFAFHDVEDISFDKLDEYKLYEFFDKISFIDIKKL